MAPVSTLVPTPETGRAAGVTLVLPTYNEAPNLARVLEALAREVPGADVLVADDDSSDGTRETASSFSGELRVGVLHRREAADRGLTASVADAILRAQTAYVVVMDADLQHPPSLVPALVRRLEEGDDVVVGTRDRDDSFTLPRRLLSRGARLLARRHLRRSTGVPVADAMSGFFAIRTDLAQDIVRRRGHEFQRSGFKVLMDLLLHAPPGVRVGEVPYAFQARHAGESKLTRRHYLSFLRQLGATGRLAASFLDLLLSGVLFRFAAVGLSGVLVNLGVLALLTEGALLPVLAAAPLAIEASVLWNFAWNESWTFRGRGDSRLAVRVGKFHLASLVGMALQYGVIAAGALWLPQVSYLWTALAGIALGSAANFLLNLRWTWGVPVEEPEPSQAR